LHAAAALSNGKVVVIGGYDDNADALDTTEAYDQVNQRWVAGGSLREERFSHSATLLQDGRILVAGGETIIATDEKKRGARHNHALSEGKSGCYSAAGPSSMRCKYSGPNE
jgi:hypothetical protein